MSYIEYGRTVLDYTVDGIGFIHQQAFPLCADLVHRLATEWPFFNSMLRNIGETIPTYALEVLSLYISYRILLFIVRLFSSTIYRMLRLILTIVLSSILVLAGLYFYFTNTAQGQKYASGISGKSFWMEQMMNFASQLTPVWEANGNIPRPTMQLGHNPPRINFQNQQI